MDERFRRILSRCAIALVSGALGLVTLPGCTSTKSKAVAVDPPAKKSLSNGDPESDADDGSDSGDGDRAPSRGLAARKPRTSTSRLEVADGTDARSPSRDPAAAPSARAAKRAPEIVSSKQSSVLMKPGRPQARVDDPEEFDPDDLDDEPVAKPKSGTTARIASSRQTSVPGKNGRPQAKQADLEDFDPDDLDDEPVAKKPKSGTSARVASASSAASKNKVVPAEKREESASADESFAEADRARTNLPSPLVFEGAGVTFKKGKVAATVNGQPIFAEDVLRQVPLDQAQRLAQAEQMFAAHQLSEEDFTALQQKVIEINLPQHEDRELLLQALKTKVKEDALKGIQKHIDANYNNEYLPHVMKLAKADTEAEFDEMLRKQGSSIETLRTQYRNKELAQNYLGSKAMPKSGFDRPDVLKYYQEHKEDYAIRAQAKWDQINLKFAKNGGQAGTRKKAHQILQRLDAGEDFAEIAKEFSNGPMASNGGKRGWTTEGSLANKAIEQALYELPLGEISDPIESKDAIDIVRVVDRTDSGYQPFAAVQEDIKTQLKNLQWQKATKALLEELREKATIETFIDKM